MALEIRPDRGEVKVNGQRILQTQALSCPGLVETGPDGVAYVYDGGAHAATIAGPQSTTTVYAPPSQQFVTVYYNSSYRWRLKTPGGSIGIRA